MKLVYHEGKNFGDAINPLIFNHYLPNFFNTKKDYEFLGIGSILGLNRPDTDTKKIIVFSSGFGGNDSATYGELPTSKELEKYDIRCVRGPLTCKALGIDEKFGICDGAILLPKIIKVDKPKKHKFSYMPHTGSLVYFPKWKELLSKIDINLIDPSGDVPFIIDEINQTETMLTEAMHGAIISDAYRVPWIPVKSNITINKFKWTDYCESVNLKFEPNMVKTLYSKKFLKGIFKEKLGKLNSKLTNSIMCNGYKLIQNIFHEKKALNQFKDLKNAKTFLSEKSVLEEKQASLIAILKQIHSDY